MLATLALALLVRIGNARADLDGDTFHSEEWKVSIEGPKGWQLSENTSYPSVLLWMVHRSPDARMLFSAEPLPTIKDSQSYALETVKKLEAMAYRVRTPQLHSATGAFWVDFDNGEHFLRQAVLVVEETRMGYALTLSAPDLRTRGQFLRAFDFSLRHIVPKRSRSKAATSSSAQ